MAQYDEPINVDDVIDTFEDDGISEDTTSAIEELLEEITDDDDLVVVEEFDGSVPEDGTDVLIVGEGDQLTGDPDTPVIIMDADAEGADITVDTDDNDRVVVAGDNDDTITTTGEGDVTVDTGIGEDNVSITGSGDSSVDTGDGEDVVTVSGVGTTTVDAGDGNDTIVVRIDDDTDAAVTIDGGDGFDGVSVNNTYQGVTTNDDGTIDVTGASVQLENVEMIYYNDGIYVVGNDTFIPYPTTTTTQSSVMPPVPSDDSVQLTGINGMQYDIDIDSGT